jgi:hypothetical protein
MLLRNCEEKILELKKELVVKMKAYYGGTKEDKDFQELTDLSLEIIRLEKTIGRVIEERKAIVGRAHLRHGICVRIKNTE